MENHRTNALSKDLFSKVLDIYTQNYDLTTDSRQVKQGSIFVALKGENFDANTFTNQALQQGAVMVVIDNPDYYVDQRTLLVDNTLTFLQKFANFYRNHLKTPIIAITGTNGKTTTKELTHAVLSQKYKVIATQGNLNNQIGVPLTLLRLRPDTELAIIEMGASHIGDIAELCDIAQPNYGLITNIGVAHIQGFGSKQGVIQTKTELYQHLDKNQGLEFVNIDDEILTQYCSQNAISYSLKNKAEVTGKEIISDNPFAQVKLFDKEVHSQLIGQYNVYNILAAASIGSYFKVESKDIIKAIEQYTPQNQRSQVKQTPKNTLILDCYNANPSSCKCALESFAKIPAKDKRVYLGAMKELGSVSVEEHKALVDILKTMQLQEIILVGQAYKDIANEENLTWFETSLLAKDYVLSHTPKGATILIKGSRSTKMEVIADAL